MRRRPKVEDMRIADYIRSLPRGEHTIYVDSAVCPPVKSEGGLVVYHEGNTISITIAPFVASNKK
jgi:hypothetical protein